MSAKNQFTLHVDHLLENPQAQFPLTNACNCEINVQVADGWAITGHYQNNTLHTVTLQKISQAGENNHG